MCCGPCIRCMYYESGRCAWQRKEVENKSEKVENKREIYEKELKEIEKRKAEIEKWLEEN